MQPSSVQLAQCCYQMSPAFEKDALLRLLRYTAQYRTTTYCMSLPLLLRSFEANSLKKR